ncbi:MAG: VacJ family lipoprotein [Alphaproteobacteria bacterium]|nr:VacJ family lipoprotein [Alphaproteobacteria bacterium]
MRNQFPHNQWKLALVAALATLAVGCTQAENGDNDPWEPFNRGMYQFNSVLDGVVLKPITQIYRGVIPDEGQTMVHHFVENLQEPISFGNSVLQADPQNSFVSLWRFLLNSTIGVGGLFDVASDVGLKGRKTDFGQTLALYGVESGPYLFLPILGPSNARDGLGRVADAFMHPAMYVDDNGASIALWSVTVVDTRSDVYDIIEDIQKTSLDPYVTFRSSYTQRRNNNIKKASAARDAAWKKAKGGHDCH